MEAIDFNRSFVTFRIDTEVRQPLTVSHKPPFSLNNARIPIECRCTISEKKSGAKQTFVLGASCKTERVGVEEDIWTQPNADYCPIFSEDRFLNLKTYARVGTEVDRYPPGSGTQSDRQSGRIEHTFDSVRIDITAVEGEALESAQEIVTAVLANQLLVAHTELENDRYHALIEYPVKTINANERDWIYQTDTGPVLFPDLSRDPTSLMSRLELAFAAFNNPKWIEFLLRVPTNVADGADVYHYSRSVRCDAHNQIIRL
ncbi:MAG: hypothetical protein CMO80_13155 [Verrucomicrobiales bacterium]|nr:hypothetical protein [Verrucomicrobiales bacterium]|tara:strand:- start:1863 stop:2639 length:777 start_codon:yes stop_codon:yes gene_type:complete